MAAALEVSRHVVAAEHLQPRRRRQGAAEGVGGLATAAEAIEEVAAQVVETEAGGFVAAVGEGALGPRQGLVEAVVELRLDQGRPWIRSGGANGGGA